MATAAAEQTGRHFFREAMYTFRVEVTRPKYRSLDAYVPFGCGEAYRGMCGSARQSCPEPKKVWPEDYEKSTKNRAPDSCPRPSRICPVPCGAERTATRSVGRNTKRAGATCAALGLRRAAKRGAKRGANQDQREFQPGHPAGHGEGPLRQPGPRSAPRRIPRL